QLQLWNLVMCAGGYDRRTRRWKEHLPVTDRWKRLALLISLIAVIGLAGHSATPAIAAVHHQEIDQDAPQQDPVDGDVPPAQAPVVTAPSAAPAPTTRPRTTRGGQVIGPSAGVSNNNYYTNVDGNTVHSPAYSTTGTVPSGATAQCGDGTYSFSQHAQGTC